MELISRPKGLGRDMEFHPIADLFPMMVEKDFNELVDDIRQNGLHQPIVVYEGHILDGRNRYRACKLAGVTPKYVGCDYKRLSFYPMIVYHILESPNQDIVVLKSHLIYL